MLLSKTVIQKWNSKNKKHYIEKGYTYTKMGDEFEVMVEDLTLGSDIMVEVKCDCEDCKTPINKPIKYQDYLKCVKDNDKYYCKKCASNLYGNINRLKTQLLKSKSFEQWCYDNLSKEKAEEILSRWDYEKNIDKNGNVIKPNDITFSSTGLNRKGYWFKCDKHPEHESELKNISGFTNGRKGMMGCKQCNSFKQWCIENNRQDVLDRWDYELNEYNPEDISYGTSKSHWFKCLKHIEHRSELKYTNHFVNGHKDILNCKQCNSIGQYLLDTYGENGIKDYWSNKNTVNPFGVNISSSDIKVWIKCQNKDKSYHGEYEVLCNNFTTNSSGCPYCSGRKVHPLDSLGQLLEDRGLLHLWSDKKNKKSPYKYMPMSHKEVWWKCPDGIHEDYKRIIDSSNNLEFKCPSCSFSKGEKKIEEYLIDNKIEYIPQKEFDGLVGLKGGNLSYDFYIPKFNLLIEYQGEFHDGNGNYYIKKNLKKQKEHDRRKKEYAENNKINLLPIWYWDYDNIEEILNKEI